MSSDGSQRYVKDADPHEMRTAVVNELRQTLERRARLTHADIRAYLGEDFENWLQVRKTRQALVDEAECYLSENPARCNHSEPEGRMALAMEQVLDRYAVKFLAECVVGESRDYISNSELAAILLRGDYAAAAGWPCQAGNASPPGKLALRERGTWAEPAREMRVAS